MARSGTNLKMAKLTISSPNHPTSNVKDAFSSNFPNYLPASPDYFPASLGNTYSSSSNSFGVVPIALPTLLLFHDDPYMKVMQAFYDENSPIPPPTIIPQSSMLNPQELFLPKELLPPKKRARAQISKLQKKQMGNNHKISLARFRITDLEHIINDIQIRHQEDKESLPEAINELKHAASQERTIKLLDKV
ncbi:hypothetical protein Tco_0866199 [Tanacetum coccineum]